MNVESEDNRMEGLFELDYAEVDGFFYPNIEIDGGELFNELGKYGSMRLEYLHEHKMELYLEMLLSGWLAEHCKSVDEQGFKMSEQIQDDYIKKHMVSDGDFIMRVQVRTAAQQIADEIVLTELVYK